MKKSKLFILPSLLIILSITLGELIKPIAKSGDDLGFITDPRRLMILGFAYCIAILCFLKSASTGLFLIRKNILFFLFLIFSLLSFIWSKYSIKVVVNFGHYLGFLIAILAMIYYFKDKQDKYYSFLSIVMGFSILISIIVTIAIPQIGIHEITGRWQGVTGNPNTLGVFCIISFWAIAADYFLYPSKSNKWKSIILISITLTALIGAKSTTSYLISILGLSGMWFLIKQEKSQLSTKILLSITMGWFGITVVIIIFMIKPELLTLEGSLAMVGKDATLTGRTTLWHIAGKAIDAKPFLGWSFDSNRSVLEQYGIKYGQFHNGYLDLIVRGGYVSLILFIIITIQLIYRIKVLSKHYYKESVIWLILLTCILIHNITETSIMRETHILWYFYIYILFQIPSYNLSKPAQ